MCNLIHIFSHTHQFFLFLSPPSILSSSLQTQLFTVFLPSSLSPPFSYLYLSLPLSLHSIVLPPSHFLHCPLSTLPTHSLPTFLSQSAHISRLTWINFKPQYNNATDYHIRVNVRHTIYIGYHKLIHAKHALIMCVYSSITFSLTNNLSLSLSPPPYPLFPSPNSPPSFSLCHVTMYTCLIFDLRYYN